MITQEDIARVALELEQAEDTVSTLRLKRWTSKEAGAAYASAKGRIELVGEELERLNTQYEAEQQALADRPNVEKAAAKEISAAVKELEASRDALTTAASTAQQALIDLADAAEAHNALIARHSAALTVRGLALEDEHDHQTGGGRKSLRIRGDWWVPVDASSLMVWVLHRVASVKLPRAHQLVGMFKFHGGRRALEERSSGLLDQVAKLPKPAASVPTVLRIGRLNEAVTYIDSVEQAEKDIRQELGGWQELARSAEGAVYAKGAAPSDHVKAGVEARIKQLHEAVAEGRTVARYR